MFFIASASSFGIGRLKSAPTLFELPKIAHGSLGFQGLAVPTPLLAGWERRDIDRLRDNADKEACPCLLLIEPTAQPINAKDPTIVEQAQERLRRVLRVAHRLACSNVAISIDTRNANQIGRASCRERV